MFCKCNGGGLDFAFPDACNTVVGPAVTPLPYPNFGLPTTAIPTQYTVYLNFMPGHNLATTTPTTLGDTTGTLGGVASGMFIGPARNVTCSTSLFYGTSPATRMLDVTGQNGVSANAVGATLAPSQIKVLALR